MHYIGMKYVGMKYSEFLSSLKQADAQSKYIHYDTINKKFKILSSKEKWFEEGKKFERISYSLIVKILLCYKEKMKKNFGPSKDLKSILFKMSERKNMQVKKYHSVTKFFYLLFEKMQNKADGFGFISTASLYLQLTKELDRLPPYQPSKIPPIANALPLPVKAIVAEPYIVREPISPLSEDLQKKVEALSMKIQNEKLEEIKQVEKKDIPLLVVTDENAHLVADNNPPCLPKKFPPVRSHSEFFRREAFLENTKNIFDAARFGTYAPPKRRTESPLEIYKNELEKCHETTKIKIFSNLTILSPAGHKKNCTTRRPRFLEDLLAVVCESNTVSLHDPKCMQVIIDAFTYKDRWAFDDLVKWLKNEQTFHLELLEKIFEVLNLKYAEGKFVVYSTICDLFYFYREQLGKRNFPDKESSSYRPGIVMGMKLLLALEPNNDKTIDCLNWFLKEPFELENFEYWMEVFVIRNNSSNYSPAQSLLLSAFFEKGSWLILQNNYSSSLIHYLEDCFLHVFKTDSCAKQVELFNWMQNQKTFSPLLKEKCLFYLYDRMIRNDGVEKAFFITVLNKFLNATVSDLNEIEKELSLHFNNLKADEKQHLISWIQSTKLTPLKFLT